MKEKAQASLEYLMTYGWALIIIISVVSILVFILNAPSAATFSSSDPAKIMLKAGLLSGSTAEAKLQNVTGGQLEITSVSVVGGNYSNCTVNGLASGLEVGAGQELTLECSFSGGDSAGSVRIDYEDFSSLQRSVTVRISSGEAAPPTLPPGYTGITTCAELQAIENDSSGDYALMANIDCSETTTWNEGAGFDTIGNGAVLPFTGNFDGQGFEINNLYINRPVEGNVGLFGRVTGSVSNLGIANADITGGNIVGTITGFISDGTIANCHSSGSVSGSNSIGGLAGYMGGSTISDSYSTASVLSEVASSAGGLIGFSLMGSIDRSYATGNVSGTASLGGLVGSTFWTQISDCYATGGVSGNNSVGGLVGWKDADARVNRCYSTGAVSGDSDVGGLVGYDEHVFVFDSFWDTETSGQVVSAGGTGKTTAEMMQQETFDPPWDFSTIWTMGVGTGYPTLR